MKASSMGPPSFTEEPSRAGRLTASHQPVAQETVKLSDAAERLLGAAANVGERPPCDQEIADFTRLYSEWITFERGMVGPPEERIEQWLLLLHCMLGASTLFEALQLLARFSPLVRPKRGAIKFEETSNSVQIRFEEPHRPGPEGLISDLWALSVTLCEFEFLSGAMLQGVRGRSAHQPCLPHGIVRLLFDRPLIYGAPEAALEIPRRQLDRPVLARASDVEAFSRRLLPATLGLTDRRPDTSSLVEHLVRIQARETAGKGLNLPLISDGLGCSPATLRRRLSAEGATFREIKEAVYDSLSKQWLSEGQIGIDAIADRLGYSDTFAFRRFFQRRNGCSPSNFRRATSLQSAEPHPDHLRRMSVDVSQDEP